MSNPQQPELARSRKTPHQDQDSVAAVVEGQPDLDDKAPRGPIPPENQAGHHPPEEQDKPDLDAFAQRLGVSDAPAEGSGTSADQAPGGDGAASTRVRANRPAVTRAAVGGAVALAGLVIRRRRKGRRS